MSDPTHSPVTKAFSGSDIARQLDTYGRLHDDAGSGALEARPGQRASMARRDRDLATDFREFVWGRSFHFAPRRKHESFPASLIRYQRFIAISIDLKPGMRVLDVGCGIGGPMREIVRLTGAHVIGLNINVYQLQKCRELNKAAGIEHRTDLLEGDFLDIPLPDASVDAVYQIGATCHTTDKIGAFSEIFRVLRPGGLFASDGFCLTPLYRAANEEHRRLKKAMERGARLPDISTCEDVNGALEAAGFELLEARDMTDALDRPWHSALGNWEFGLRSTAGRRFTTAGAWALEKLGVVPKGTTAVARLFSNGADGFVRAGRLGIFTANYYTKARKPESPAGRHAGAAGAAEGCRVR